GRPPQTKRAPQGDNPFGKMLQDMFGGGGSGQAPRPETQVGQNPLGDTPWGRMLEEMLGGARPAEPETPRRAPPSSEQQAAPDGRQRNPYEDIFGRMFETGRQQRDDYEKDRKSTRLNSSHVKISYAVFCLKKKKQ